MTFETSRVFIDRLQHVGHFFLDFKMLKVGILKTSIALNKIGVYMQLSFLRNYHISYQ